MRGFVTAPAAAPRSTIRLLATSMRSNASAIAGEMPVRPFSSRENVLSLYSPIRSISRLGHGPLLSVHRVPEAFALGAQDRYSLVVMVTLP